MRHCPRAPECGDRCYRKRRMGVKSFVLVWARVMLVAMAGSLCMHQADAQDAPARKTLRVAIKPIEPFVIKQGAELSGFSIDLWNMLAQSLKIDTAWVEVTTVSDQLQAVRSGRS